MRSQLLLNQDALARDMEMIRLMKELSAHIKNLAERLDSLEERVSETVGLGG